MMKLSKSEPLSKFIIIAKDPKKIPLSYFICKYFDNNIKFSKPTGGFNDISLIGMPVS